MNIRQKIMDTGAVIQGNHFFALKSRRVATAYIDIDPIFTYPNLIDELGEMLVQPFQSEIEVLAGPAVGGIPLIFAGSRCIKKENIRTVWADKKTDGSFEFQRMGFAKAVKGRRVLVLEDVATTGASAKAVCELVKLAGGFIIGISFIWNRGKVTAQTLQVPKIHSLVEEPVPSWEAGNHTEWGHWPLVADIGHPDHFPDYQPRIKLLT